MKCPNCGLINPESAQRCDCGYNFDKGLVIKGENVDKPLETKDETNQKIYKGGFLSFHIMLSGLLIKILYIVGMVVITIGGIIVIYQGSDMYRDGEAFVLGGIAVIIFGNLLWRILCEGCIVIFSLHETTLSILKELKRK